MVISSLSTELPAAISKGLRHFALPSGVVAHLAHLPPLDVLFAALLGYNPLEMLLSKTARGKALLAHLPPSQALTLKNPRFFPQLIARPFMNSLHVVFLFSAAVTLISAGLSVFRGERFIYDDESVHMPVTLITHHRPTLFWHWRFSRYGWERKVLALRIPWSNSRLCFNPCIS